MYCTYSSDLLFLTSVPVSVPHGPRQLPPSFCPRGVVNQDLADGQALAARAGDLIKNVFLLKKKRA